MNISISNEYITYNKIFNVAKEHFYAGDVSLIQLFGCASHEMLSFQLDLFRILTIHNTEARENIVTQPINVNHFISGDQRVKIVAQSDFFCSSEFTSKAFGTIVFYLLKWVT